MSFFAVQKYNLSYIYLYSSSSTGTLRTSNVTSFQLVESRGHGSKSRSGLKSYFCSGFTFTNVYVFFSSVQIYELSYIHLYVFYMYIYRENGWLRHVVCSFLLFITESRKSPRRNTFNSNSGNRLIMKFPSTL